MITDAAVQQVDYDDNICGQLPGQIVWSALHDCELYQQRTGFGQNPSIHAPLAQKYLVRERSLHLHVPPWQPAVFG